jgi:hypothetical protein
VATLRGGQFGRDLTPLFGEGNASPKARFAGIGAHPTALELKLGEVSP